MVTANIPSQPSTVPATDNSRPRRNYARTRRIPTEHVHARVEQVATADVGPSESSSAGPSPGENVRSGNNVAREGRGRGQRGMRATGRGSIARNGHKPRTDTGAAPNRDQSVSGNQNRASHVSDGRVAGHGSDRQFGGRLTTVNGANSSTSALHGDATVFIPGHQHSLRPRTSKKPQVDSQVLRHDPSRGSNLKSTKPDIASRTHEDISNGLYECPICTSEILRSSKVWSCKTCWTVFHLACIATWAKNEGSTKTPHRDSDDQTPQSRQWRCPGCNLPKDALPSSYTCWCEKEVDPRSISGLPPHSCGQTCGKNRLLPKKCPHPCEMLCHAGPCPPCTHMGPVQSCFCGKKRTSQRCVDTNYTTGWSCGEICGDLMPCGEHTCQRPCHEGLCGACDVKLDCRCYCGKSERLLVCYERGPGKHSQVLEEGEEASRPVEWNGSFDCASKCGRLLDCGKHTCSKFCHPQDLRVGHCPRSPDVVINCPCGKTSLSELSPTLRKSCEDPIPNCEKRCLKNLACGHSCQQICHADACMPCTMIITIGCRCGRVQSSSMCHQGNEAQPQCLRTCKATLNCGRHECGERCCPGERKAADRQATKRKLRPLGNSRMIDEGFEAEHICTRLCGRALKCGNHTCMELCHKGPCGSCREAIFDDVSCHCGKTILQPPLPCGTVAPKCRFECERPKRCEHPRISHHCHGDEENCPKCPFLTTKPCMCGKKALKNQPCWLLDVRCGEVCGRKLKCGSHFCRKPCHRPGQCEDVERACHQSCGRAKKICGHPCEEPCHAPSSCREDRACQNRMLVTCSCQHLKQELKCGASKSNEGNSKKMLDCDSECARLERNRKLALALNIDPEAHKDDHIPYCNETLKMYREAPKWAQAQEREFRVFAADESEKRLRFKPMPSSQRSFLHSLADDFGFDSESMDPEPHRHVAVFKTPKFVMAPMKTLAECIRIRNAAEAVNVAAAETERNVINANEPYNGFVLTHPRFGLTLEELRNELSSVLNTIPGVEFDISFLPNEEIVLKARPATPSTIISYTSIDAGLKALRTPLSAIVSSKRLATSIQLCTLDNFLNLGRRELDSSVTSGGWSQVAAKGAAPRSAPRQTAVGEKSMYTVLGSRLKDMKKKQEIKKAKQNEAVVEDWEEEMRKEEAAQKAEESNEKAVLKIKEIGDEIISEKETSEEQIDERTGSKDAPSNSVDILEGENLSVDDEVHGSKYLEASEIPLDSGKMVT